jgi:hypothetical protein
MRGWKVSDYPQADEKLKRAIWNLMQSHTGYERRVDRDALVYRVKRLTRTSDRQVRDALAELPVVWDDGYFIPTSYNEASGYIASMRSRQAAIGQRLRVLDDYLRTQREQVRVEQMRLEV